MFVISYSLCNKQAFQPSLVLVGKAEESTLEWSNLVDPALQTLD
jgi:hypothetical protein